MNAKIRTQVRRRALAAAIAAGLVPAGAGAAVARLDFAHGDVTGRSPDGQERKLAKGAEINEGDTIVTRRGRAQLRFTDGARTSLLPNSEFRVDEYSHQPDRPQESKGFFSLLRGGLRTITALIGRERRDAYRLRTPSATIGIRGTEYLAVIGNSLSVWVGDGEIEACNNAGCETFEGGESGYIADDNTRPIHTDQKPDTSAGNTGNDPYSSVEDTDSSGTPAVLATSTAPPLFADGAFYALSVAAGDKAGGQAVELAGTLSPVALVNATFNGTALNAYASTTLNGDVGTATAVETGGDGIVGWGRWTQGTINTDVFGPPVAQVDLARTPGAGGESHHYAIGIPTAQGAFPAGTATYSLLGATSPTFFDASSPAGVVNTASLLADFGGGTVDVSMNFTIGGGILDMNARATMGTGANRFRFTGSGSTTEQGSSYPTLVKGFFAGDQAARAGLTYHVALESGQVTGAAAFTKAPAAPAP